MLPLTLLLFVVALILFWAASRQRRSSGLPAGRVIYADTGRWSPLDEPLFDHALALTGKPDYLVAQGDRIIPVEVKSSAVREAPYDEHIYQLAAYCLLVHRVYGKRPPYGILHYPKRTFAVDYTADLEEDLLELLVEMRAAGRLKDVPRSHDQPGRCQKCGFRSVCDDRL